MIYRTLKEKLIELSQKYPVVTLTGPRQSGKSTLLRYAFPDYKYVSLEDPDMRLLAENDPRGFLATYPDKTIIDEAQRTPALFSYIQTHTDREGREGMYLLAGSHNFLLMENISQSLAGRTAVLKLLPFSHAEMAGGAILPSSVNEEIFNGGYPRLYDKHIAPSEFYSYYIQTYVERDVRDLSGDIDALKFLRFLRSVAARVSQLVSYKSMADDAEIPLSIAKSWLDVLETQGIVFLLHPYSNNVLKRTIKTPKLYFYDTGLVCYLARWASAEVAETGVMNGALLENFAVSEIVKSYQNAGLEPFVYYYRDRDDKEIDLLLERDGTLFPIEIKKTTIPDRRITKGFGVIGKSPLKRGTGAVLCLADTLAAFDADNLIVPIWLI